MLSYPLRVYRKSGEIGEVLVILVLQGCVTGRPRLISSKTLAETSEMSKVLDQMLLLLIES